MAVKDIFQDTILSGNSPLELDKVRPVARCTSPVYSFVDYTAQLKNSLFLVLLFFSYLISRVISHLILRRLEDYNSGTAKR